MQYVFLGNATNVSPPNSQPIKLRIFKDKTTSKLVSVSEAPPPMEMDNLHHPQNTVNNAKSKPEKIPKKRGRKPKNFNANLEVESPVKTLTTGFDLPPPPPEKKGRSTRNSRKNQQQLQQQQLQQDHNNQLQEQLHPQLLPVPIHSRTRNSDSSIEAMPILSRATSRDSEIEENMTSENSSAYSPNIFNSSNSNSIIHHSKVDSSSSISGNVTIEKKLEDDAEFQQLSQMLSSMEEESHTDYHHHHQTQQQHHQPHHHHPHSYNSQMYSNQFQQDKLESAGIPTPTRTLSGGGMNIPSIPIETIHPSTVAASSIPQHQQHQQQEQHQTTPPVSKVRDAQDIRAILEGKFPSTYFSYLKGII